MTGITGKYLKSLKLLKQWSEITFGLTEIMTGLNEITIGTTEIMTVMTKMKKTKILPERTELTEMTE